MSKDFRLFAVYVPAHLFLDWVSFIHELSPLNITPWNPPAGLALGVLIAWGPRMLPPILLALVAGDVLIRGMPTALWAVVFSDGMIAGSYGLVAWVMRSRLGLRPDLGRVRDIAVLMVAVGAATIPTGACYVAVVVGLGLLPSEDFMPGLLRYWVGETIGIMVLTPAILAGGRFDPRRARPTVRAVLEAVMQGAAIALALWAVFGPLASERYEYFYLLFLPMVWIASRHGLAGAVPSVVLTQVGLIAAVQVADIGTERMIHFQLLMLALTVTTLLLGAVVSERRRAEAWVRERREEFAHASRLTEAGEMTAALAHEINQPLAAGMSYARAARKIALRDGASPQLLDILDKTVAQAERADRVMRSLRDFVRKGESRVQAVETARAVAESLVLAEPEMRRQGVDVVTEIAPGLPPVAADPIQLQQVLLNLVRNAAEALVNSAGGERRITLSAGPGEPGFVEVAVRDTGPGFSELVERNLFTPFVTTKADGMGLGLSIARSIVEGHGGTLNGYRLPEGGTIFRFTLPIADNSGESHA